MKFTPLPWEAVESSAGIRIYNPKLRSTGDHSICNIHWKTVKARPEQARANKALLLQAPKMVELLIKVSSLQLPDNVQSEIIACLNKISS